MTLRRQGAGALARRCLIMAAIAGLPVAFSVWVDPRHLRGTPALNRTLVNELTAGHYVTALWNQDDRALQRIFAEARVKSLDRLIIGSSRTQAIPPDAYPEETSHNASVANGRLDDMLGLYGLRDTAGKRPRALTIGLDPWTLIPLDAGAQSASIFEDRAAMLLRLGDSTSQVRARAALWLEDLKAFTSPEHFRFSVFALRTYGLRGPKFVVTDTSLDKDYVFTPHGNIIWPKTTAVVTEQRAASYIEQLRRGRAFYNGGTDVERADLLEALLRHVRQQGIEIDVLLLPFHPRVYTEFASRPVNPLTLHEARFRAMAQRVGAHVIGAYDPASLRVTAADMFDESHMRPEATVRIIREAGRR